MEKINTENINKEDIGIEQPKVGSRSSDNFDIVTKLRGNHLIVRCKYCGKEMVTTGNSYKYISIKCLTRGCINTKLKTNLIGNVYGDFTCIAEEKDFVTLKCSKCRAVFKRYRRALKKPDKIICENINCENRIKRQKELKGTIAGDFECIQDLPGIRVKVKCIKCNTENIVSRYRFNRVKEDNNSNLCNNIRCDNFDYTKSIEEISELIAKDSRCLSRLGINKIEVVVVGDNVTYAISTDNFDRVITTRELKKILKFKDINIIKH